ncbi:protein DpdG [Myxococcota bacterium]
MSLLSTFEAVPRRLEILFSMVAEKGTNGYEKDKLRRVVTAPEAGKKDGNKSKLYPSALKEALALGVLEESDEHYVVPGVTVRGWAPERSRVEFRHVIETLLLPTDPLSEASEKASPFPLAISWLLLQKPWAPLEWGKEPLARLRQQIQDESIVAGLNLNTYSAWQNLVYWGRFLGLCSMLTMRKSERTVIPDPTKAIRRHIAGVLPSEEPIAIRGFLDALKVALPVLDGGPYQAQLLDTWNGAPYDDETISGALSLAMLRLQASGLVNLEMKSDADVWLLDAPNKSKRISHITRL